MQDPGEFRDLPCQKSLRLRGASHQLGRRLCQAGLSCFERDKQVQWKGLQKRFTVKFALGTITA
jgi:hypothetical protein